MEQLRADLRLVQDELEDIKSITESIFASLSPKRNGRQRLRTRQRQNEQLPDGLPGVQRAPLERALMDAYRRLEKHLEELNNKFAALEAYPASFPNTAPGESVPPASPAASVDNLNAIQFSNISPAIAASGLNTESPCFSGPRSRCASPEGDVPQDALDRSNPETAPDTPTLTLSDLGNSLIPNLKALLQDDKFAGKLFVQDIGFDSEALLATVQPPEKAGFHTQFEVNHQKEQGIWHLYAQPLKELHFPDLTEVEKPCDKDVEQYLEDLSRDPPKDRIPYYIGPLSEPVGSKLQSYFPSGASVSQLGDLPGVSTLYSHVGEQASGTTFHCEDASLRSYNLTLIGWKIWILIKPNHTAKFEALVRRLTRCDSVCDQFVRHMSIIIPPSRLRAEKIEFDIICSGPGEMVLTQPRQYHAVINWTASFAVATNFVLPGEDPIPRRLSVCHLDGLYYLEHRRIRKLRLAKRKECTEKSTPPRPKRRPLYKSPGTSVVEALVRQTASRDAVLRFIAVVDAWRKVDDTIRGKLSEISNCDEIHQLTALDGLRRSCTQSFWLFALLEVLTSVRFLRRLPHSLQGRVASQAIDQILANRGHPATKKSRKSLHNELAVYRKWEQLCGAEPCPYEGILCFVPPVFNAGQDVTKMEIYQLRKPDYQLFYSILQRVDYAPRLCKAGAAFQREIFGSEEMGERPYEAEPPSRLAKLDLAALLDLL
jgi:hypothetical protein